jgi:hypothetical protein
MRARLVSRTATTMSLLGLVGIAVMMTAITADARSFPDGSAATPVRKSSSAAGRRRRSNPLFVFPKLAFIVGASPQSSSSSSSSSLSAQEVVATHETILWTVRLASAAFSYTGLVAYLDRPRGGVQQQCILGKEVEIRASTVPGAGLGLFATAALPKHTVLGTYPGVVLPLPQNLAKLRTYPACEGYIWRFSDNRFVIDPTNAEGVLDSVCRGGNPSLPGSTFLFRTLLQWMTVPTTLCRINEPPRGKDVNVVTEEDLSRRCVTFSLERDVNPGEELFIDYGLSYDRSLYGRESSFSSEE